MREPAPLSADRRLMEVLGVSDERLRGWLMGFGADGATVNWGGHTGNFTVLVDGIRCIAATGQAIQQRTWNRSDFPHLPSPLNPTGIAVGAVKNSVCCLFWHQCHKA